MSDHISNYICDLAVKRLSGVEIDPTSSNQHELNGTACFKNLFGNDRQENLPAAFMFLSDEGVELSENGVVSWYDSRENHPTRSEYRLYYSSNSIFDRAHPEDLLLVSRTTVGIVLFIVAPYGSTMESQLLYMFGLNDEPLPRSGTCVRYDEKDRALDFITIQILESLGITPEIYDDNYLERMVNLYGSTFPTTRVFSDFARSTLEDLNPREDPDLAVFNYMEREELLFRTFERHITKEWLDAEFDGRDVDTFISKGMSLHQRRRSRAGFALENHLAHVFEAHDVRFSAQQLTENRAKPDFIFPSIEDYRNEEFPSESLSMLGAKNTCKDRWRQVLPEADRINYKHVFTLEPSISVTQTAEMIDKSVGLVIPSGIHPTYTVEQRSWLLSLSEFIGLVLSKQ